MQNICFVCTGNTCRSPVAEKILTKYLKQAGLTCFSVSSCGLNINKGDNINPYSIEALKDYGIKVKSRKAKALTKPMLKKYNLFITMTKAQKQAFSDQVQVFSFGELVGKGDILDPFGMPLENYKQMAKQIDEYCQLLVQKLNDIKGAKL